MLSLYGAEVLFSLIVLTYITIISVCMDVFVLLADYSYYMETKISTSKCVLLSVEHNDDTPIKAFSASTSDIPRMVLSPERHLVLSPVFESDNFKALRVKMETVRLSGFYATGIIKSLVDMVKLSDEVDNAFLRDS